MSLTCFLFCILQALALVSESYQQCYEIEPPLNGDVLYDDFHSFYEVVCDEGYMLHGEPIVHCIENSWESPRPTCIKIAECEALPDPKNGRVKCDRGRLIVGKVCRYTCFEGYKLRGVRSKTCMHDYTWSGPTTKCVPISDTFCQLPPPLRSGTVIDCTSANMPRYSQRCTFRCNRGYVLRGPTYLTCGSDGRLTDDEGNENFPECVAQERFQEYHPERLDEETQRDDRSYEMPSHTIYEDQDTREFENDPCVNFGCKHICKTVRGRARCKCRSGYTLAYDEKSCIENSYSEPAHDSNRYHQSRNEQHRQPVRNEYHNSRQTSRSDPCGNQCEQLCRVEDGQPRCRCETGYKINSDGRTCRINKPCRINNGGCSHSCTEIENSIEVICTCPAKSVIGRDGKTCMRERTPNPRTTPPPESCHINKGGCQHHCRIQRMQSRTTVQCSCQTGYRLHRDGKHCVDIDECSDEQLNRCQHYCANTEGGYNCFCRPGYIQIDRYNCQGCRKDAFWSNEFNGCVDCPQNSHTDSEGKTSIEDCSCDSGFIGSPGEYISCKDIDECRANNFGCSHTCINIPGDAYCTCPDGFILDADNKTCIDNNECSVKNGGCEGLCHNTEGSFYCSCPEGFTLSRADKFSCDDIDECLENNGGCEQKCINYRGGYYCACETGYRLDSGAKNCTDIMCPALPMPHYSTVQCKQKSGQMKDEKLPEMDSYQVGTICTVSCFRGFKNTEDSNKMKCQNDGTWKGTLPECKPLNCPRLEVPENGDVYPPSCSTDGVEVKQKCTFICHPGYKLEGKQIFVCKNNLTWNHEDIPVCEPEEIQPTIQCPRDIHVTLLPGKATQNVTIPEPVTNMEDYAIIPAWVSTGIPIEFPAGVSKITFTAVSLISNSTAKCDTTVTVLDEEPPVFEFCPDPIRIEDASADGERVTWEKPVVSDNVELISVFSILEPNTTLTPGTHFVEYIARDSSGNIGKCSFDIAIIRMNCSVLLNPDHGEANCFDWMFGKLCKPQCEDGYMRDPDEPIYYSCDDSGSWEPSDVISECLEFSPATSSTCEAGFELKTNDETGEEVCVKCPSNTVWSASTRKCE